MSVFLERVKDLERRVERLESEAEGLRTEADQILERTYRILIEGWAVRLTDSMTNPTINWPEIHRVVDAMHEFGRRKEVSK